MEGQKERYGQLEWDLGGGELKASLWLITGASIDTYLETAVQQIFRVDAFSIGIPIDLIKRVHVPEVHDALRRVDEM